MRRALRQICESARRKDVLFAAGLELQFAFEDIDETLRRRGPERAAGRKLRGHLREARAQLRRGVDDELHALAPGSGVRMNVSGVCSRWSGFRLLRVDPR